MSWERLSLHFRQTYEGGYRYLDKCGELNKQEAAMMKVVVIK